MEFQEISIPDATKEESKSIKAISKDTVHKICSGQVVLSLAVAVKELVENAIDAGATLVEVKLRDQGLESVEVSDNGCGVEESNLEGMTAKYHTSKLREFVDLQSVETFGFRGEALSSLCALANMSITTRHKSTEVAIKIDLDHDGKIKKRQPCARGVGTTVTLTNLFETLPVRRRDFVRNIKKEFTKMCQILQAYCLVSRGVRIICSNQTLKGAKSIVVQTHGSQDILANVSSIFGSRQVNDILPLKCPLKDSNGVDIPANLLMEQLQNDVGESFRLTKEDILQLYDSQFKLEGYISSCEHGSGRSSKDRQYFFVNSRPCDPKNISKVVNDCYHRYNVNQFPFIYLNIITDRQSVDINLTKDKRQLLLNNEKILLALIKKAIITTFGNIPSTFKMQNTTISSILGLDTTTNKSSKQEVEEEIDDKEVPITSSQKFAEVLSQWKLTGDTQGMAMAQPKTKKRKQSDEIATRTLKLQKIQDFLTREELSSSASTNKELSYKSESDSEEESEVKNKADSPNNISKPNLEIISKESVEYDELMSKKSPPLPASYVVERIECKNITPLKTRPSFMENKLETNIETTLSPEYFHKNIELDESDSETEYRNQPCSEIQISLVELTFKLEAEESLLRERQRKAKLERLRFKSEINPNQNKNAEAELQKEITKSCFAKMEILGQFNLGFIIAKLDTDLFIVDQHATDEKYNFETLQNTVQLQHQPLAVPQTLDLTAVNEMVLIDHLPIFEKNGFKFEIDDNAAPTRRVRLLGKPFSKNWEFGKEDIDELIFMLQDAPEGTMCRPSRIRAMFASRACRKSVMIGKALKKSTMEMLVRHMGEIEQPWNCPHGRPTMRHLINTAMLINDDDEDHENVRVQEADSPKSD
ncbi:mismatch repair endonuclease PMS2 isoform X1 [Lucilia cuprina]|uniref:mismatch repair endonuclease PMS2 isoform X1 n=1 Tax=Lucilia cuprina TaxID=7375 RepID=UPI001F053576|nr:mismatch repair endonuclease PMS2 isoform X1 [Lucilia cuprina]